MCDDCRWKWCDLHEDYDILILCDKCEEKEDENAGLH
jgi:hypothetical protein